MKIKLASLLITALLGTSLLVSVSAVAGDNDDIGYKKPAPAPTQTASRDPFQLPADAKKRGLVSQLNKLAPASGE